MAGKIKLDSLPRSIKPSIIFGLPEAAHAIGTKQTVEMPNFIPPRLNELLTKHWAEADRMKKAAMLVIGHACKASGITQATGKRMVRLRIVFPKGQRRGDPDAYWKVLLDGLVNCGALRNDSGKWCSYEMPELVRGNERRTVIELEDI